MARPFQPSPRTMLPAAALLLGLLGACGGGGSAGAAPDAPAAVEVLVADESTGSRRLLGMAEDGSGSRVLVADASRVLLGSLSTFRTDQGLVYALKGGGTDAQEVRLVTMDGKTDRSLRRVEGNGFLIRPIGVRAGHLVIKVLDAYYTGPLEALPLAGGASAVLAPKGGDIFLGAKTALYQADPGGGQPLQARLADLATGASQAFTLRSDLSRLPSGGFLMGGTWNASFDPEPLSLHGNDFELVRDLAPSGTAARSLPTVQFPGADPRDGGDRVFGLVPEGAGRRLMAYSRTGAAAASLDGSSLAGSTFLPIGVVGTRLVYRADQADPATESTQSAYRSVPLAGGTIVELAPPASREDERVIGTTTAGLVAASAKAENLSVINLYPAEGGAPVEIYAWGPGGAYATQAWIAGDRLVYVAFDGSTYRLSSVDARGRNPKVHLESATALTGVDDSGTGVYQGRMCFTRGNDLLLLDPAGAAPAVLHSGSARGSFAGWGKGRVFYQVQEPGTSGTAPALWSARLDGGDPRRLSVKGWLAQAD